MLKPQSRIKLKKYLKQLKSCIYEIINLNSEKKEIQERHERHIQAKDNEISQLKIDLATVRQRMQRMEIDASNQICHNLSLKPSEEFMDKSILWFKTDSYTLLNDVTLKRISDVLRRVADTNLLLLTPNKDIDEKGYTDEEFAAAGFVRLDYDGDKKIFYKHCNKMRKIREDAKLEHLRSARSQTANGERLSHDIDFGVLKHKDGK